MNLAERQTTCSSYFGVQGQHPEFQMSGLLSKTVLRKSKPTARKPKRDF